MTTIVGIRKDNLVVIAGDGQASLGNTVMKSNVKKIRRLGHDSYLLKPIDKTNLKKVFT